MTMMKSEGLPDCEDKFQKKIKHDIDTSILRCHTSKLVNGKKVLIIFLFLPSRCLCLIY